MDDEPTPWEDINPPMVSAPRRAPQSRSSAETEARKVFRNELTACLALVAPVGMTEENRKDWLTVAWETLRDIPPDILKLGAKAARQKCDHPCKIVPTIIAETADYVRLRRERIAEVSKVNQLPPPPEDYCSAEEAARILSEFGLKRGREWSE